MKSPITGKEMILEKELRVLEFRKESFQVVYHFFKCEDSGEQFTSNELDDVNLNQIYNQYRDRFNIPFPDEIFRIRKKYGLSAVKMSNILGFGVNSYRQYEAGEMPSVSNARLIQMIDDPRKFVEIIDLCESVSKEKKDKYIQRAEVLLHEREHKQLSLNVNDYLLGSHLADVFSGYRNPSLEKFTEMVVFFADRLRPFKTKMNKLLFYADFLMYKQSCFSISGVRYKAIEMGPVPQNFQSIFEYLLNNNEIDVRYSHFPQGYMGERFISKTARPFNDSLFSKSELEILDKVASTFKNTSTSEIIKISHSELAWKNNESNKNTISYQLAFDLHGI